MLEVVDIEENSGLSRWGWAAYYAELQGSNRDLMFVARVANGETERGSPNLAGYIVARLGADELHINNVAVRDELPPARHWAGPVGQDFGARNPFRQPMRFSGVAGWKHCCACTL